MAKKAKKTGRSESQPRVTVAALSAVAESTNTRVVDVPQGATVDVIVDVNDMAVPYAVRYGGATVIKATVDRASRLPVLSGDHKLLWSFIHQVKGWKHVIGLSINDGPPIQLESRSEAQKDPDVSTDFIVLRA